MYPQHTKWTGRRAVIVVGANLMATNELPLLSLTRLAITIRFGLFRFLIKKTNSQRCLSGGLVVHREGE